MASIRKPKFGEKGERVALEVGSGKAALITTGREAIDYLALLGKLEKTEVFREASELIERNDFMDKLRKLRPDIDWDDVIFKMEPYSLDGIMAFLKKKEIVIDRPPPRASASIESVMADPKMLEFTINRLEWDHDHVDPRHFGAFVLLAAERHPQVVFDFFSTHNFVEIRDPHFKGAVVALLNSKGFEVTSAMFEPKGPKEPVWD